MTKHKYIQRSVRFYDPTTGAKITKLLFAGEGMKCYIIVDTKSEPVDLLVSHKCLTF